MGSSTWMLTGYLVCPRGSLLERIVYPDVLKAVLNACHEADDQEPLAACVAPHIVVPDMDIPEKQ